MSTTISVIGLGYVGLPIAVEFSKKYKVIGFDISEKRVSELRSGFDRTGEIHESSELKNSQLTYSCKPEDLALANFHIVTVPTPINNAKQPDLSLVHAASRSIGKVLKTGDTVVYESTVYPGVTEDECVPILEEESGLTYKKDFKVGYSPERINPGDKEHTLTRITKVVSGCDEESLGHIAEIYGSIITAGIYKAESIKVAEAAKVIENTQRDLNIAFTNELSLIFQRMGIDTHAVLKAAGTKWNFLNFTPGLVGGHCIGVDPYYLTHIAMRNGYHPDVILAGRRINDDMGLFVANQAVELLNLMGKPTRNSVINILGLTFKENCPDVRNTRVVDIYNRFMELGCDVHIYDPLAEEDDIKAVYGNSSKEWNELTPGDITVLAAPHELLKGQMRQQPERVFNKETIFIDVKGALPCYEFEDRKDRPYWRL